MQRIGSLFIGESHRPHVEWLHAVWDYKSWLKGEGVDDEKATLWKYLDPKLKGFKYKNCFCVKEVDHKVQTFVREWAEQEDEKYEQGITAFMPNTKMYPTLEAPPLDAGPTDPVPFSTTSEADSASLLNKILAEAGRSHKRWNGGKRANQDAEGDWIAFMQATCHTADSALLTLGKFCWPPLPERVEGEQQRGGGQVDEQHHRGGQLRSTAIDEAAKHQRQNDRAQATARKEADAAASARELSNAEEAISIGTHLNIPAVYWEAYLDDRPDEMPTGGMDGHFHAVVQNVIKNRAEIKVYGVSGSITYCKVKLVDAMKWRARSQDEPVKGLNPWCHEQIWNTMSLFQMEWRLEKRASLALNHTGIICQG